MNQQIKVILGTWYDQNKRDLPWRETQNPYFIWLSEIILQQTRVAQGLAYYQRFTTKFPTIIELAKADEMEVLQLWQGLGYYSRARNLHATAKHILTHFNGKFPEKYSDILSLKGIGPYTAAAIASFSFNLPHAVVDGNVYRVLSRLFDVSEPIDTPKGKKSFQLLADELLDIAKPARHNQAMMEFGATLCTPSDPSCPSCPLRAHCMSFQNKTIGERPIKFGKTKVIERTLHYLVQSNEGGIYLSRRTEKDIWQHLYEFPQLTQSEINDGNAILIHEEKHLLSHRKLTLQYYSFESKLPLACENSEYVTYSELDRYPKPKPIQRFIDDFL